MCEGSGEIRILGLDVGKARVGVAMSDPLGLTAQPLPTLPREPEKTFLASLAKIIETHRVTMVVLGLPLGLKGQKGSSHDDVMVLLRRCQERWPDLGWETQDERFTSSMANEILRDAPRGRKRKKGLTDQIAAQLILQDYLERVRRKTKEEGAG